MPLSAREIVEILRTLDELGYNRFRYEQDDVRLEVDTSPAGDSSTLPVTSPTPLGATSGSAIIPEVGASSSTEEAASFTPPREGLISVNSPMTGTFYRASSPDAPPYVEVGSRVDIHDTVCLVDVMKLFNSISAGTRGTVAAICAENEAQVKAGQPLMWIESE